MDSEILISVVVVTYNHEKYIEKALNSIVEQSLFNRCEIVIGDDGSKDKTVSILNSYMDKYSNIKVYAHENVGISQNVYDLFCRCKGRYIAVLEGDDYWISSQKLERQISEIEENNCIAVAANSVIVDDDGNQYGYKNTRSKSVVIGKKEIEEYGTTLWMPSGLLFRNIFLDETDETLKVIRDASRMGGNHSGLMNLLGSKGSIYLDTEALCVWRQNIKKEGSNYSSRRHNTTQELLESLNKYCMYQRVLNINQTSNITYAYMQCKKQLKKDYKTAVGNKQSLLLRIRYYFDESILGKLSLKIKRLINNE